MDKYEYQVCADQIKTLIKERHFSEAMDIADTIDWRRVKSFSMLCTVSEIYKVNKHYSEARDILLLAYERYPDRANVVYALCELAIKLDDVTESIEYYKEYVRLKPHDSNRYVLLYKIYEAQEVPLEEKISLLEEFKRVEYTEKWAYELALLYHKDGQETKCVETCDELVLWFGEGPFVRKALELKMQHAPLTKEQQRKYDGVYDAPAIPKSDSDEQVHIYETQSMNAYANGASPFETAPMEPSQVNTPAPAQSPVPASAPTPAQSVQKGGYQGYVDPGVAQQAEALKDIKVQPLSTDKYSTMNLQEELAKNMEEFYSREKDDVAAPYYGSTSQLYEPSQAQFINQINQAGATTDPMAMQYMQNSQPLPEQAYMYAPSQVQEQVPYAQSPQQMYEPQQYVAPQQSYEQPQQYVAPQQSYEQPQQYVAPQQAYEQPQQYVAPQQQYAYEPEQVQEYVPEAPAVKEQEPVISVEELIQQHDQAAIVAPQMVKEPVVEVPEVSEEPVQEIQEAVEATIQEPTEVSTEAPTPVETPVEPEPKPVEEPVQEEPAKSIVLPVYEESVVARTGNIGPLPTNINAGGSGVPKEYEDKLREGLDGQVTMALPDAKEIEKQITGQIDISDFMKDWEAKKKSGEEHRRAQIKAKSLEQTNDIMAQLVGVIPGIENGTGPIPSIPSVSEPVVPEEVQPEVVRQPVEEVLRDDKKGVVTKTTLASPTFDRTPNLRRTESGSIINGPMTSSITGEIPDILPSADIMEKGDILPSGHRLTIDEEYGGNIAKIRQDDAELVKRLTGELPPVEEPEVPEIPVVPEPIDYGEAEEIEDVEQPDVVLEEDDKKEEDPRPVTGSIPPLDIPQYSGDVSEQPNYEQPEPQTAIVAPDPIINDRTSKSEPVVYPYEVEDDYGEVEELTDLDQPEEVDDMLKTRPIPVEEIEARQRYEAGIEDEEIPESEAKKPSVPAHMVMEEDVRSRRDFEEVERAIFGRFEGIESLKSQIVDVMDYMSMDPRHGNVVIIGSELFGRKDLAIDIVKATQSFDKKFLGKVAKISGEALNKKNIPVTLGKLKNGALIVENAGGLTPITVNSITESLLSSEDPILVVFEGEKDTIEPLLNGCVETKTVFDARIVINDFNDDDLVAYAKGYAREQEYSIDEMGTLALHTKIADMQTYDHKVSIQEVIDIVDSAIRHVDRKNMSHFMDVLVGKRYDDDDFIVLREKDFML